MENRNIKVANFIKELSANFLIKEENRTSLITVTNCTISNDLKKATIYITVLPNSKEKSALDFCKRKRSFLRDYIKKNMNSNRIPFLDFAIDLGEKNRQKIDELLRAQ